MENKQRQYHFQKGMTPWNKGRTNTPERQRLVENTIKKCKLCGSDYYYKQNSMGVWVINKDFCSAKCLQNWYAKIPQKKICLVCGKLFKDNLSGNRKYCSHACYWQKMKELNKQAGHISNYKYIRIDKIRIAQHRYLIEQKIGRKLEKNELVHHIDGNKLNNDIDNLELLNRQALHTKKHFDPISKKLKAITAIRL